MCGTPTSAECFEASPPLLPGASRAGCWLPEARLSFHAPSQARHWLKIRTIMFWTLRCCDISGTSAPARCFVALGCFVNSLYLLSKVLVRLLLAMLFLHGSWGPTPWLFSHGFSGPNPWLFHFLHGRLAVFHPTFSGHLLDVNLHMFHHRFWSSTTFIDFNVNVPFRITDADQSIKTAQFIAGF